MLKVPASISKITTMADNTLRLFVDTQELHSQDKAELMSLYNQLGVFFFDLVDIKEEDRVNLPDVKSKGEKTPSQRLRARMFIHHREKRIKEDFEAWYKRELDKIGEIYLEDLT